MLTLHKNIFLIELRKIITYRSDFWVNFVGRTFFSISLAYYLWTSIFDSLNVQTLGGYTIKSMIIYYLLAPLIFRIQQGSDIGTMSKDIYEGSLNKYLLYPLSFFSFKITTYMTHSFFYFLQLICIVLIYQVLFYDPTIFDLTLYKIVLFIPALALCSLCYFLLTSIVELISFWADNIWSLNVIIRFVVAFFGGVFIPLSFFPENFTQILMITPFPHLINFPMKLLLSTLPIESYFESVFILIAWSACFGLVSFFLWKKGKYQYTGVGI